MFKRLKEKLKEEKERKQDSYKKYEQELCSCCGRKEDCKFCALLDYNGECCRLIEFYKLRLLAEEERNERYEYYDFCERNIYDPFLKF